MRVRVLLFGVEAEFPDDFPDEICLERELVDFRPPFAQAQLLGEVTPVWFLLEAL
ncbi:MAG: hypothetical protein LUH12_05580 [Bacteroides sp.]|nr:hypothetical protein [Bacteroides sp.]